jgi:hypothetical protein
MPSQDEIWDKIRGEIKATHATKDRIEKDYKSGQRSLFPIEDIKGVDFDPNREKMFEKAVEKHDAKEAEKEAKKAAKATKGDASKQASMIAPHGVNVSTGRIASGVGSGSGSMGTGKMNRDISKNMKKGGKVSSASKRADGCCVKGKTKGRMV